MPYPLMQYTSTKTNLPDCLKGIWIKTMVRSSLVCICFDKRLHVGNSYKPKTVFFMIKPTSFVTASNNPASLTIIAPIKRNTQKQSEYSRQNKISRIPD